MLWVDNNQATRRYVKPLTIGGHMPDSAPFDKKGQTSFAANPLPESMSAQLTQLLLACQQDNADAFHQLYQLTAHRLNGIAFRITGNSDSSNEVLQEAFIQIWQKRHSYQTSKSEAYTWLASIVRYRAYDRLRYDKIRPQHNSVTFNEWDSGQGHDEADSLQKQLQPFGNEELDFCLAQLEQKQRQSILMAYLYGYSREDVATHFKSPVNTIKSWIRRGLGRLLLCLNN